MRSIVTNEKLQELRDKLAPSNSPVRAWMIQEELKNENIILDTSTIRGRFIEMGMALSGDIGGPTKVEKAFDKAPVPQTIRLSLDEITKVSVFTLSEDLKQFIPQESEFNGYIERPIDTRLAVHYNIGPRTKNYKYPLTQGKQGTGKTFSHAYYAYKNKLPFILHSCYEDYKLRKQFGDKTIVNGTIVFKESLFVKAIQSPCVILFDEINAISNTNSFDFHALLQNRELYVKDASNGDGKVYKLHPECRIGFAQNPKSAKYIGGNIKPSNFLGRCTFITYPEFDTPQIKTALKKRFPQLEATDLDNFTKFYFACVEALDRNQLPVDISMRQINNVIELWLHGLPLKDSIEDGLTSMLEAASQPQAKKAFHRLSEAIWESLMEKKKEG